MVEPIVTTPPKPEKLVEVKSKKLAKPQGVNPLMIAYLQLLKAVRTGQETATIHAKGLEINAAAQNSLIKEQELVNFISIKGEHVTVMSASGPSYTKVIYKTKEINEVMIENEEISAVRGYFSEEITQKRQGAQLETTEENSVINKVQQTISESAGLMQMLMSLTNQVTRV